MRANEARGRGLQTRIAIEVEREEDNREVVEGKSGCALGVVILGRELSHNEDHVLLGSILTENIYNLPAVVLVVNAPQKQHLFPSIAACSSTTTFEK